MAQFQLQRGKSAIVKIKNYPPGIDIKPEWQILSGDITVIPSNDGKQATIIADGACGRNRIATTIGNLGFGIKDITVVEHEVIELEFELLS